MNNKRYEIFISSTYEDLKEERIMIQSWIINNGHIPTGMELFHAANINVWDVIKPAIDSCDYFILVIAGKYGDSYMDEKSYTELEYEYAKNNDKIIISFLLSEDGLKKWPSGKVEDDKEKNIKLSNFRSQTNKDYVNIWEDSGDLKSLISTAIPKIIDDNPSIGWVRATQHNIPKVTKENSATNSSLQDKLNICNECLRRISDEREIFKYLFNALTPLKDLKVDKDFLLTLETQLANIGTVFKALETIMREYIAPQIANNMRVYFAYKLRNSDKKHNAEAMYKIAISNTKDKDWRIGLEITEYSNCHAVYISNAADYIPDVRISGELSVRNQALDDELSVYTVPILYNNEQSIGVIGFSSSIVKGLDKFIDIAKDTGIIFSALFHTYGQHIDNNDTQKVTERLRLEIAEYFAGRL